MDKSISEQIVFKIMRVLPIIAAALSAVLWVTSLKYKVHDTAQELSELQDDYLKRINDLEERVSKLEGQFSVFFNRVITENSLKKSP